MGFGAMRHTQDTSWGGGLILNAVFDCNRLDQAGCYLVLPLCFCKLGGLRRRAAEGGAGETGS